MAPKVWKVPIPTYLKFPVHHEVPKVYLRVYVVLHSPQIYIWRSKLKSPWQIHLLKHRAIHTYYIEHKCFLLAISVTISVAYFSHYWFSRCLLLVMPLLRVSLSLGKQSGQCRNCRLRSLRKRFWTGLAGKWLRVEPTKQVTYSILPDPACTPPTLRTILA